MNVLEKLQPEMIWHYFGEIMQIPRPSKHEELITKYLIEFGVNHGLETLTDEIGNVLIRKPATQGMEDRPWVCLQSHIDMVCEKNSDKVFDFQKDSIVPIVDGEWLKADGTTLGADDGIGVATELAILAADNIEHGPIECLFTVDEETGLSGAFALKNNWLKSRILLNLDSEDEGEIFIGCAGGIDTTVDLGYDKDCVEKDTKAFIVKVSGLKGGHSGDDINKGLGCANKIITRILWRATDELGLRIAKLDGGNISNAIAREAYAIVTLTSKNADTWKETVNTFEKSVQYEFRTTEPNLKVTTESTDMPTALIDRKTQ
ncbi:MAG: beta-Ala-His dipeptidase, partial [Bacteroidales bacterium]|nr:beta-Ala-His dipeptidase [Bacteroidales bacterium]